MDDYGDLIASVSRPMIRQVGHLCFLTKQQIAPSVYCWTVDQKAVGQLLKSWRHARVINGAVVGVSCHIHPRYLYRLLSPPFPFLTSMIIYYSKPRPDHVLLAESSNSLDIIQPQLLSPPYPALEHHEQSKKLWVHSAILPWDKNTICKVVIRHTSRPTTKIWTVTLTREYLAFKKFLIIFEW